MRQSSGYVWQAPGAGLGASTFTGGIDAPGAAVPAAGPASPQAAGTGVGRDGYGVVVPGQAASGSGLPGLAVLWSGGGALALLGFLWWSLPK
jgi:hypothetical protein